VSIFFGAGAVPLNAIAPVMLPSPGVKGLPVVVAASFVAAVSFVGAYEQDEPSASRESTMVRTNPTFNFVSIIIPPNRNKLSPQL